jgi:GNAT superfamily N-acetyltransferase
MVTLRPANSNDIETLQKLLAMLFTLEQDFEPDVRKQHLGLELLLKSDQSHVVIAETAGDVIGMATLQLVISTAEGAAAAWIEDVIVDPAWRGQGIGGRLLDSLAEWATTKGVTRLQLVADCNNQPALDFYASQGWDQTALIALRKTLKVST